MMMIMMTVTQVAVCCSQEQVHTQEFIRNVEPPTVVDCDAVPSPTVATVLPPIGELHVTDGSY